MSLQRQETNGCGKSLSNSMIFPLTVISLAVVLVLIDRYQAALKAGL